jgi:TRAP-type mannitol/chloroaromatic compound transport system permease small subunit
MLKTIDKIVAFFGLLAGWLTLALVILIVVDVSLRFTLDLTATWVVELEWQLFATAFLLGIPYAWQQNRHVRVDLFYDKFSRRDQGKVDFFGTLIFLIPWCLLVIYLGFYYARAAWITQEGSPNPGGLPTFVPIKVMIPFSALLLLLQSLATGWRAYLDWRETTPQNETV